METDFASGQACCYVSPRPTSEWKQTWRGLGPTPVAVISMPQLPLISHRHTSQELSYTAKLTQMKGERDALRASLEKADAQHAQETEAMARQLYGQLAEAKTTIAQMEGEMEQLRAGGRAAS